jgi:hypothetical protein
MRVAGFEIRDWSNGVVEYWELGFDFGCWILDWQTLIFTPCFSKVVEE